MHQDLLQSRLLVEKTDSEALRQHLLRFLMLFLVFMLFCSSDGGKYSHQKICLMDQIRQ